MGNKAGQALVEFSVVSLLLISLLFGAVRVVGAQWNRARCAHFLFEKVRSRLSEPDFVIRRPAKASGIQVRLHEDEQAVHGEARCGNIVEKLSLKKLEAIQW